MLIHRLPDHPGTRETQPWLEGAWNRENRVVWGRVRHADFGPNTHPVSIRAAWGGAEQCFLGNRTVAVDDDNFLLLNRGEPYSAKVRAMRPLEVLAIFLERDFIAQVCGTRESSIDTALSQGDTMAGAPAEFTGNLRPHDRLVSPVLRYIKAHLLLGVHDEAWYEEQLIFLLQRLQTHQRRLIDQVESLRLMRATTRWEASRRIGLATDFIHTNYAEKIDLDTLARTACLSKYHFLRLFSLVHGMTPHHYLRRKRLAVALRLLESTQMPINEVAVCVGLGGASTLLRQVRQRTQLTPQQVRSRGAAAGAA